MNDLGSKTADGFDGDVAVHEAPAPVRRGYGVLAPGDRVRFLGDHLRTSIACDKLTIDEVYTVARCEWVRGCLRLRLIERPGFMFLRSLFGSA